MTSMAPTSAAEAVANGAQLLDERHPGWWRKIDLPTLDIAHCDHCVCGQLARYTIFYGNYHAFTETLLGVRITVSASEEERNHGFFVLHGDPERRQKSWRELDREWTKVIRTRLEADSLIPSEQREQVLA